VRRLLVGASSYFASRGRPSHPRELSRHACLGYSYRLIAPAGEEHTITVAGSRHANNADALMPSLRTGLGIAIQPEFVVWRDLRERRLEAVMTDWSAPPIALNIVTSPVGSARQRSQCSSTF